MNTPRFFTGLILCFSLFACVKKDPEIKPEETPVPPSSLTFNFEAMMGDQHLKDSVIYINNSQDSFTVNKFNYFISNIKLTREDGFVYAEPESYHLIKHLEGKTSFSFKTLPQGTYTKLEFLIGVDSVRNISGAQTGDLDIKNDMYWDWNQGYLFFKLEGHFTSSERPWGQDYGIHIGGGTGANACIQKCTLSLPSPIIAKGGGKSTLFLRAQVNEIFSKPLEIGFDYYFNNVQFGEQIFRKLSENYKDMLVVSKVEN